MIKITGIEGTSEYAVAQDVSAALATLWPGLADADAADELVTIAAGAKISGYRVADLDVVVIGRLRPGRAFVPKRALRNERGERLAGPIQVSSFCAVLEVKDHDPSQTRVTGDTVEVRYSSGSSPPHWHSATEQNIAQLHSLKQYFADQTADVFVYRALVLRGHEKPIAKGTLGRTFDGSAFMSALLETSQVRPPVRAGTPERVERALSAPLFRTLRPSSLDRARMDRLVTRNPLVEAELPHLGSRLTRFRGRGGTGKTMLLLQLAWRAYEDLAARSVVLTYNHALTSDVRRLLALMGVPSDALDGGIAVKTVMSFVSAWLQELGVLNLPDGVWSASAYKKSCEAAVEMFSVGALSSKDIEGIKLKDFLRFDFNLIVADEAQDWPKPELELLKILYGPEKICLADGVDQLVRGSRADWEAGVAANLRTTVPLKRCLRMKANLAQLVNAVAERAGVNWKVEPNPEAPGGRILVVNGPLAEDLALVRELLETAQGQGNATVDNLICVPPGDVANGAARRSMLGDRLRSVGYDVWDGTNDIERRDFPRSNDALRIVQYASCRGLEGWAVFLDGFDTDWPSSLAEVPSDPWLARLMPLTRAIDTLIIGLEDPSGPTGQIILGAARMMPDIVEIRQRRELPIATPLESRPRI